jgi:hypothetical protein
LEKKYPGNIATVLPDHAERYFSTALLKTGKREG